MQRNRMVVIFLAVAVCLSMMVAPAMAQEPAVDAAAIEATSAQIGELIDALAAQQPGVDTGAITREVRAQLFKAFGVMPKWRGADKNVDELTLLVVPKSVGLQYWTDVETGVLAASEELGCNGIFDGPTQADVNEQVALIEGYINAGLDGLAIAAHDPEATAPIISQAIAAGIPTVMFDADAPNSERLMYIGTDNRAAGKMGGEKLAELMGGKGKVMFLTASLSAQNLNERQEGTMEVLKDYPEIEITSVESFNENFDTGFSIVENVLTAEPDLKAIYALSGIDIAVKALQAHGRLPGDVVVVGYNAYAPVPQMIKDGWCQAAVNQRPTLMGDLSVRWLVDLIKGNQMPPESGMVDTGTVLVTAENVDEFLAVEH